MFGEAAAFNRPIGAWNTPAVTNIHRSVMFSESVPLPRMSVAPRIGLVQSHGMNQYVEHSRGSVYVEHSRGSVLSTLSQP